MSFALLMNRASLLKEPITLLGTQERVYWRGFLLSDASGSEPLNDEKGSTLPPPHGHP